MWLLERRIVKEKESNTALPGNVTFDRIITLKKANSIVISKIAQVVQVTFIILTLKIF